MEVIVHTDGGSRGTHEVPGAAVCGVTIDLPTGRLTLARRIPDATNNVAEYAGLIVALERLTVLSGRVTTLRVRMDSNLVVEQVKGAWKVKALHLRLHHDRVRDLLAVISPAEFDIAHIPRELNDAADALANQAYLFEPGETREWFEAVNLATVR